MGILVANIFGEAKELLIEGRFEDVLLNINAIDQSTFSTGYQTWQ